MKNKIVIAVPRHLVVALRDKCKAEEAAIFKVTKNHYNAYRVCLLAFARELDKLLEEADKE